LSMLTDETAWVAQDVAASSAHAPDRPLCFCFWRPAAHLA
jgi:hypothetical protein